jgi:hypothetical protein
MTVSAGNLNALLGFSFGASQFLAVSVASYATNASGAVFDILTDVLGAPSTLAQGSGAVTYTIATVNNATSQIGINQYAAATAAGAQSFAQTLTYNVLGFSTQSLIVSPLSISGLIAALQAGQSVTGQLGVITTAALQAGTLLALSPSGVFTATLPCFAAGTRILTARGELAVETVRPGDVVRGHLSGRLRPVRWVGRRAIDMAAHPRPWDVAPVRVRAHAFAPGQPGCDLLLSPDHAVFVAGALIPVRYLLNGTTVAQTMPARVTYLHVELDAHDILLAEGLPCESFLDTGNRAALGAAPPGC